MELEQQKAYVDAIETKLAAVNLAIDQAHAESMKRRSAWSASGANLNKLIDYPHGTPADAPASLTAAICFAVTSTSAGGAIFATPTCKSC